jgi:hypothetical protein
MYFGFSVFSSPCQRQCEFLPSLGVRRPLTFHILIFSSETTLPNEVKLAHFVPIHQQTWPPQEILVSDWPIFKNLLL